MKTVVAVFFVAVLVPSAVLAVLALRAQDQQEWVIERQRTLLHQATVDALADEVRSYLTEQQNGFCAAVDEILAAGEMLPIDRFDEELRAAWPLASLGFTVSQGPPASVLIPTVSDGRGVAQFRASNRAFLAGEEAADAYLWESPRARRAAVDDELPAASVVALAPPAEQVETFGAFRMEQAAKQPSKSNTFYKSLPQQKEPAQIDGLAEAGEQLAEFEAPDGEAPEAFLLPEPPTAELPAPPEPAAEQARAKQEVEDTMPFDASVADYDIDTPGLEYRQTIPERTPAALEPLLVARLSRQRDAFLPLLGEAPSGSLARFLEDGALSILFWYRPQASAGQIYGAEVDVDALRATLAGAVAVEFESPDEVAVALLDHQGLPVGSSLPGFEADDWARPFVASELGELLPRWEVAAYLLDPTAFGVAARASRLRLGLLVAGVFGAIGCGGIIIAADARRRAREVRQKTDFVSNVSHELKTPLTSIRMFSDLLVEGEGGASTDSDPKRARYAGVIRDEAARLTRLINNVLDFSRLERGAREFARERVDVAMLVREIIDHYAPQLEKAGCAVETEIAVAGEAAVVHGDRDGLAQVVVNLLSNVEKYGAGGGSVEVALTERPSGGVILRVSDRGPGVPRGREKRIFQRFYRADNSLSSGVAGSGLGLTLAEQIVGAHGGEIRYERRDGGGSTFVVELEK